MSSEEQNIRYQRLQHGLELGQAETDRVVMKEEDQEQEV